MSDTTCSVDTAHIDVVDITHGWIKGGALMGALAVVLGVFAPQGLESWLTPKYEGMTTAVMGQVIPRSAHAMDQIKNGIWFQLTHAAAMVATGVLMLLRPRKMLKAAQWCFLIGVMGYSGGQYAAAMLGIDAFAHLALVGGGVLIIGWLALVEGACPGCRRGW